MSHYGTHPEYERGYRDGYLDAKAENKPHKHIGVGYCPICKHYGQDCTGIKQSAKAEFARRVAANKGK